MYKTDADGQRWVLRTKNGNAHVGSVYADFRGDMTVLVDGRPPHKPASSGHITIRDVGGHDAPTREVYAGVCDMEWMKVVEPILRGSNL